MSKAVADTSIFIAQETGREMGDLPEKIAVSVITVAELELGVLRATDSKARARRLSTLSRVQSTYLCYRSVRRSQAALPVSRQRSVPVAGDYVATTPGSPRRQ